MFTECPECSTAFRVTAKVLQQAAGRVRCGGCGHAFSALEHLTEELPGSTGLDETYADDAPASDLTSEEQFRETSKQLLQTLDELAGTDDVRIKDTGFEWQVLDDDAVADDDLASEAGLEHQEKDVAAGTAPEPDVEESGSQEILGLEDEADTEVAYEGDAPTQPAFEGTGGEAIAAETEIEEQNKDVAADALSTGAASATGDWNELLDEADDEEPAEDDLPLEIEEELAAIHHELSAKDSADPADLDSQFDMQAEAMGLEISGSHEIADHERTVETSLEDEEEIALEAPEKEAVAAQATPEEDAPPEVALTVDASPEDEGETEAEDSSVAQIDESAAAGAPEEDNEDDAAAFTPDADVIEQSLKSAGDDEAQEPGSSASADVAEMSEEEMTINQEIDQELLAVAQQDQDLKSTIIGLENSEKLFDEESADVETIIMEGEAIRGAFEKERERQKQEAALKRFDKAGNLIDSYITRRAIRGGRRSTDPPSYGAIAGAVLLTLMLIGQIIHANRDTLSTSELFNQTVGQVYRMLGKPVTPEWSIKGWQFEATNGSIAEGDDVLTIFSRIGNRSERPLPFPLVHVSLTDRWEEIIGSAILEPAEYLAGDQNPNQPVTPGNNFTAVITIDEPSVDATGFKLNVCYRVSPGRVRCATEDFKD